MAKGECKATEALLDVLKSIFNVWSVFTLAWAGAVGTLLKNPPQKEWLTTISVLGLVVFSLIWLIVAFLMVRFALKLKNCEEVE